MLRRPKMERFTGLLLGTAVGDSLGLPREGLSRRRATRLYPGGLQQQLIARRRMLSDDTVPRAALHNELSQIVKPDVADFGQVKFTQAAQFRGQAPCRLFFLIRRADP